MSLVNKDGMGVWPEKYKTLEGEEIEVWYDLKENEWVFELNRRRRSKVSLRQAIDVITSYPVFKNESHKLKSEPFVGVKYNNKPYRLDNNYDPHSLLKDVAVLGLQESVKGSEKFDLVKVKSGDERGEHMSLNREDLYFKTPELEEQLDKFVGETVKLKKESEELQLQMQKLQNQLSNLNERFKLEVNKVDKMLKPIPVMDELEWSIMSFRESERQRKKSEV